MIEVNLPDGRVINVDTTDQKKAAQAAKRFLDRERLETTFATLGADNPAPSPAPSQETKAGNLVSRAIQPFAEERAFPGVAGSLVKGAASIAGGIAEAPIQALADTVSAPSRATAGLVDASKFASQGRFGEAVTPAIEGVTAALETPLLVMAPGAGSVTRQAGRQAAKRSASVLDDFARVGVDPSLPAIAPQTAGRLAKPLSENFAGGITTRAAADRAIAQSDDALKRTADLFSEAGPIDAGQAALDGARRQVRRARVGVTATTKNLTFREKSQLLYQRAFDDIDDAAVYNPSATRKALNEINSRFDNNDLQELFKLNRTDQLGAILNQSGELSINDLRNMRTSIRELQNQSSLIKTVDDAALERLEATLTDDIFKGVAQTSGAAQARQLRVADRFYRRNITSIRKALKPFLREDATQEQAFRAIQSAAKGQGKGNIRLLRTLRRSLSTEQMDDVSAGVLREFGKSKEGADFSPEVFARNWQAMGGDAKDILFSRSGKPEARKHLDALARVVQRQASVEQLSNRSQSFASAQNVGTAFGMFLDPMVAFTTVIGANGMGRALMSPSFTRQMVRIQADAPRMAMLGKATANDKARVIALLTAAEKSDPALTPIIEDLRSAIEQAEISPPTNLE